MPLVAAGWARSIARDRRLSRLVALKVIPGLPGESVRSRGLADDLAERFPKARRFNIPTCQRCARSRRFIAEMPVEALELLGIAERFDLAVPSVSFNWYFGGRYITYVRGPAYHALRQPHEAAAQFQAILDRGGLILGDPIGALVHLQLGRAFALSGERGPGQDGIRSRLDAVGKCGCGAGNSPAGPRGTREAEMSSRARTHWSLSNE
jgi:hypothetical protein